jgi:O-antigen ligase
VATVVVTGGYRKLRPFHLAVCLFVLWNIVSVFWSVNVDLTVIRLQTYIQLVALVLILWDLYRTPAALKAGLQAYVLGAYVSVGSTVYSYLTGTGAFYLRYAATGFDPNDIGLILAFGIPVAWYLTSAEGDSEKGYLLRVINYAYLPAATFAILLTASRGTLIATLPAFLFVLGSLSRLKPFVRVLVFMATIWVLFTVQALVPQSSFQRLATTRTSITEHDLGGRTNVWREGIAIFSEHPLLGVGSGAFEAAAVKTGKGAHNVFLSVLTEVGLIGLILFATILAMTVHQAMRQPKWTARLWLTVLMIWGIGAFFLHLEDNKQTWLFLSLPIVGAGVSVQRDESRLTRKVSC